MHSTEKAALMRAVFLSVDCPRGGVVESDRGTVKSATRALIASVLALAPEEGIS